MKNVIANNDPNELIFRYPSEVAVNFFRTAKWILNPLSISSTDQEWGGQGTLGPAYNEFGYNEHPPATSSFLCVYLLVISGTKCREGSTKFDAAINTPSSWAHPTPRPRWLNWSGGRVS